LYTRDLESYKSAKTCVFLLAGIDGDSDEAEDEDMVKTFKQEDASQRRKQADEET
jgi:hyaluronan synthase